MTTILSTDDNVDNRKEIIILHDETHKDHTFIIEIDHDKG